MIAPDLAEAFEGKRVLITGGLGFIGSNLARELVEAGSHVVLVDSLVPEYGGNLYNIAGFEDRVRVNVSDVRDEHSLRYLIKGQDFLFNLAGQTSHLDSMENPFTDLEINCRSQLSILEACRHHNPEIRAVFASTRQLYGRPQYLPVDERHPLAPVDVNGFNKLAGEGYHLLYGEIYGIPVCVLRLTNTYGPRMRVKDARQTFLGFWFRQLLAGEELLIFGDGTQRRDFNYVDDAVRAFLLAATHERARGKVYNLGDTEVVSLAELAELLVEVYGETARHRIVPVPRRTQGDRHRRLLRGLLPDPERPGLGTPGAARRRRATIPRVLPGAPEPLLELAVSVDVPFLDLSRQVARIRGELDEVIAAVLTEGWFVFGPPLEAFEAAFARYCGADHAVGVANGTDAITIALQAVGVGPGDEVVTAANTCVPTVAGIHATGARAVLVDVEPRTHTLHAARLPGVLTDRTVSVWVSRLGRLSGWRRCSSFVTRFSNDPACGCLSSDASERRVRCRPGARLLA